MKKALTLLASLLITATSLGDDTDSSKKNSNVVNLTDNNYLEVTNDKILFVRFYAPWCEFSAALGQTWKKIADDLAHRDDILFCDVDCFVDETEGLCDTNNAEVYPTIRYGSPEFLKHYALGLRSYETLMEFVTAEEKGLDYTCSPNHLDKCSSEEKSALDKFLVTSEEELEEKLKELSDRFNKIDEDFDDTEVEEFAVRNMAFRAKVEKATKAIEEKYDLDLLLEVLQVKGVTVKRKGEDQDEL